MKKILIAILLIFCFDSCFANNILTIKNISPFGIINIKVTPKNGEPFFIRLDLAPNSFDSVQNPNCLASLRVDTGLEFWNFENINLSEAKELIFCSNYKEHGPCLWLEPIKPITEQFKVKDAHISGKSISLIPAAGERIVCELTQFKPKMPMNQVCDILAKDTPIDDNGAYLASLSFGGMVWAGRLAPQINSTSPDTSLLEHLELWRPYDAEDIFKIIKVLEDKGYIPWQAEFPDSDIDFNTQNADKKLYEVLHTYITAIAKKTDKEEAAIMLAPEKIIHKLDNADSPEENVQLFTLRLKPNQNSMILDVAAYEK